MNEARAQSEAKAQEWSQTSGFPYFDTRELEKIESMDGVLKLAEMRGFGVAPLHRFSDNSFEFGITEQTNRATLPQLQKQLGPVQATFKAISTEGYEYILNTIFLNSFGKELAGDYSQFGARLAAQPPKAAFQLIAQLAYLLKASDIHIEPQSDTARIRLRIDGVLHPVTNLNLDAYKVFLSDLQTRAKIKWGSSEPQSGRISYHLTDTDSTERDVNMRIETIPSFHGEEIVVRLFNTEPELLHLENMGFSAEQLELIKNLVQHQNGMILTVGPTGSGKTSTLYAIINQLNTPETKIVTLEDPVEYDLAGISQIPISSDDKEMFAQKLRAVLREDPNVIMIGEIRDIDTAKTALQAALTGHLVLSTFHATNSAAAISRLMDMIGNNPLLPSALHLIQAQRLARRICPHCSESYKPDAKTIDIIRKTLTNLPQKLHPKPEGITLKRGKGCPECHGIGYLGRVGIVEQLQITEAIKKLMSTPDKTTAQDIQAQAVKEGMITLLQDGMMKALQGLTTVEEVLTLAEV
jgi:type II secretory ATPase GspE/PulE/Tfp pilus assembly ATPase PilB-like protein